MSPAGADRNLLYGILALQMDFVTRDQLVAAMQAWALDKSKTLGQVLVAQGVLAEEDCAALDRLVQRHLRRHDAEPGSGLAASPELVHDLDRLGDEDIRCGLSSLGLDGPTTDVRTGARVSFAPAPSRYRVLRLHATGGLGQVSLAFDEQLRREVALKEIQPRHADRADNRARFLREAEITARLEHPGVVPVYGLDSDEVGRPCYAMRFVRGESLRDAIAGFHRADQARRDPTERALALRGLLRRFLDVCNTVAYAHSRGVIHRDVKPANVMLGDFGETIVVDWGLARVGVPVGATSSPADQNGASTRLYEPLTAGGESESTSTQQGQVVGTVAFMAPEQARGEQEQVGPGSDVFALGALLYCLLTGQPPYRGGSRAEQLEEARRGEPPPARQVNPRVPAALEAVCRKAMAPAVAARYRSAGELAGEVERFLADEPVLAYREPAAVRVLRWARRHRTLVSSGVVLLLAGVVGLALGLWAVRLEQAETARQRDHAEENLERAVEAEKEAKANLARAEANLTLARQAVGECFGLAREHPLLQADRARKVRKLLMEKTLPFYQNFRQQRPDDPALAAEQAEYLSRVGYITAEIDRKAEAVRNYEQALVVYQRLVKGNPSAVHRARLAGVWTNLSNLQRDMGKPAEALRSCNQACALLVELTRAHPGVADYQTDLADAYLSRGYLLKELGRPEEALKDHERARDLHQALRTAHPKVAQYQAALARSLNNLGNFQRETSKQMLALASYRQALEIRQALTKAHPTVAEYRADLAGSLNNLGLLLRETGSPAEALRSFEQARDLQVELTRDYPEVIQYRADLARTWNNVGLMFARARGKEQEAQKSFEQARDIWQALTRWQPEVTAYRAEMANVFNSLGVLQGNRGKYAQARQSYEQARAIRQVLAKAHPEVTRYQVTLAGTCTNLGNTFRQAGQPAQSLGSYAEALALLQAVHRREPDNRMARVFLRNSHIGRARALGLLGRHQDAVADWDDALRLDEGRLGPLLRYHRALALARAGEHLRAVQQAEQVARIDNLPGPLAAGLAGVYAVSAQVAAREAGRPLAERDKRSEQYARAAVALLERARQAGYFADRQGAQWLKKDAELDFLRPRDDFRQLLSRVEGASRCGTGSVGHGGTSCSPVPPDLGRPSYTYR
jgi:serine/threonine-protein kinase